MMLGADVGDRYDLRQEVITRKKRLASLSVQKLDTGVVLTVSQAVELAQVSEWTIRKEIREGRLRARRIGSCVRITRAAFEDWLSADDTETPNQ